MRSEKRRDDPKNANTFHAKMGFGSENRRVTTALFLIVGGRRLFILPPCEILSRETAGRLMTHWKRLKSIRAKTCTPLNRKRLTVPVSALLVKGGRPP